MLSASQAADPVAAAPRLTKPPAVERRWPGATIVCMATGPSLTETDARHCKGRPDVHTIAVNDAYKIAPWAEVIYSSDAAWWRVHQSALTLYPGSKFSIFATGQNAPAGVVILKNTGGEGLELDPYGLRNGRNSGYAAMNLAVHLGAARILLLGYDMQLGPGGRSHFFGDHPIPLNRRSPFPLFVKRFETIVQPLKAAGIEVVNCTRSTALRMFPTMPIEEALP